MGTSLGAEGVLPLVSGCYLDIFHVIGIGNIDIIILVKGRDGQRGRMRAGLVGEVRGSHAMVRESILDGNSFLCAGPVYSSR